MAKKIAETTRAIHRGFVESSFLPRLSRSLEALINAPKKKVGTRAWSVDMATNLKRYVDQRGAGKGLEEEFEELAYRKIRTELARILVAEEEENLTLSKEASDQLIALAKKVLADIEVRAKKDEFKSLESQARRDSKI